MNSIAVQRSTEAPSTQSASPLEFLTELAATLSRGRVDLPGFPKVALKIRDALNDPNTAPETIVKLVAAEPLLVARLLQTANSAAFNPAGKRICELRPAMIRLGRQVIQGAAVSFAVQQMKCAAKFQPIARSLGELWADSVMVACLCQTLARRTQVLPDEAFLAGLMHGIGRLYILAHAFEADSLGPQGLRIELVNDWHPSIAKAVLENWECGEALCEAVGAQTDYDRVSRGTADLSDILIVAIILAEAIKNASRTVDMTGVTAFPRMRLTLDDCVATMAHAESHVGALRSALGC